MHSFCCKFSEEDEVSFIELEAKVFVFYQPEPFVWWVLGAEKPIDTRALRACLEQMYGLFALFYGSITRWVKRYLSIEKNMTMGFGRRLKIKVGAYPSGLALLDEIQKVRKSIRKEREKGPQYDHSLQDMENRLHDLMQQNPIPELAEELRRFVDPFFGNVDFQRLHLFYDLNGGLSHK